MGQPDWSFVTLYNLPLLLKKSDPRLTPLGNPAMNMLAIAVNSAVPNAVAVLPVSTQWQRGQ